MTVEVEIDGEVFPARFEERGTPRTVAAIRRVLPYGERIVHVRWSGEACWIPPGSTISAPATRTPRPNPAPGQMILYPGGVSETEILLA